jgi:hypothetical protein
MPHQTICKGCGSLYTKKKHNKVYCSLECYRVNGLRGEKNPFYGRTHSEELILRMKEDDRFSHKKEKNAFYGRTHSEETVEAIKEKNRIWRLNNKELALQRRLHKKGLTKESLERHWEVYKTTPVNKHYFTEVVGVDPRTFYKFLVDCEIATKEQITNITDLKQMFQSGYSISAPELKLLELLKQFFGTQNVEHQVKKFGFWFDFCLFERILIEYDGFYYHKVLINKNDPIKEQLALHNGFEFVRIEEDDKRCVDWDAAIQKINAIVQQIKDTK